jgi:hypothetical protein
MLDNSTLSDAICVEVAGREREHTQVRMCIEPTLAPHIERQCSMFDGSMIQLADKVNGYLIQAGACHRKADSIPVTMLGKMWTIGCVTEVAEFPHVSVGCRQFVPRGAAVASPSCTQRQTRRMQPRTIVHDLTRHKKWTSQIVPSEKSHCNAGRDMNGKLGFGYSFWLSAEN